MSKHQRTLLGSGDVHSAYRMWGCLLEGIDSERGWEVMVNKQCTMVVRYNCVAKKANGSLGCITRGKQNRRRKVMLELYAAIVCPLVRSDPGVGIKVQCSNCY